MIDIVKFVNGNLRLNPSLLAADFANLESDIRKLESSGAEILHLDIMDGHFVPNISFGVPVVEAIRRVTDLTLDVHLMLSNPMEYLGVFRRAGADLLSIHIEAVSDPRPLFDQIRKLGALSGLVLNPPTSVERVEPFIDDCDLILVMGVMPGFGGQKFEPLTFDKLRRIRSISKPNLLISVDGGVGDKTIEACAEAGANLFVVGTSLFNGNIQQRFRQLSDLLKKDKGNL
ncbi:MAG: ribulose-phosphate 3-epimerase [Planctomycetaceae bacterium]|jgi:ribulose-phosphate 3-epimerase|nr:ribulose-phosphate 3-epimerase [Planctomycetaceae bacterium]